MGGACSTHAVAPISVGSWIHDSVNLRLSINDSVSLCVSVGLCVSVWFSLCICLWLLSLSDSLAVNRACSSVSWSASSLVSTFCLTISLWLSQYVGQSVCLSFSLWFWERVFFVSLWLSQCVWLPVSLLFTQCICLSVCVSVNVFVFRTVT